MQTYIKYLTLALFFSVASIGMALELDFSEKPLLGQIETVDIHGFFSQGMVLSGGNEHFKSSKNGGSFDLREYGFNFGTYVTDDLYIGSQLFGRTYDGADDDSITIDWALADYRFTDWIGVRAGIIKMPYGLYNETRDVDALRTQILLPMSIYNESLRDALNSLTGVGLYGDIYAGDAGSFSYQAQFGNMNIPGDGTTARTFSQSVLIDDINDADEGETYNFSLQWDTPIDGLILKGTSLWSKNTLSGKHSAIFGPAAGTPMDLLIDINTFVASAEYTINNLILAAEYFEMRGKYKYDNSDTSLLPLGWHVTGTYQFNDKLSGALGYSEYISDRHDRNGKKYEAAFGGLGANSYDRFHKDWTVSLKYNITDNWIFKIEDHIIDGTALLNAGNDANRERYSNMLMFKTTLYF